MAKCGDCIHADICKQVNGGWFSPENIAYCKGFKDRTKYVEVVRCKYCKNLDRKEGNATDGHLCVFHSCDREGHERYLYVEDNDFCSCGERKTDV